MTELARQATESFIDAQKKLADVAGKQLTNTVKTASKSFELLRPFPFVPLADLTREGVKSYVDAQKALMDVVVKPVAHKHPGKPVHHAKKAKDGQEKSNGRLSLEMTAQANLPRAERGPRESGSDC